MIVAYIVLYVNPVADFERSKTAIFSTYHASFGSGLPMSFPPDSFIDK